ncbi:L,D-transpeptidase [Candidatus Woesebacteria bacterium]|nr:MAG: L,D-transpeptidase [Candidatus Woesebacteria bacterium]
MHKNFLLILASSTLLIILFTQLFNKPTVKQAPYEIQQACAPFDISGIPDLTGDVAYFENKKISVPDEVLAMRETAVLGVSSEERWIEVDLSEQKLIAWEGNTQYMQTPISSGLKWWKTPTGEFRIWIKLRATKMEGGEGRYYYNLPNVPYVMFFENDSVPGWKGYGIHGAYWHNEFGTPRSHGCVNLPVSEAAKLYDWASPTLPSGKWSVKSDKDNQGTRVVIHE